MKAQIFYEPKNMKLEEVPVPEVELDQVLVRVKACGICASDIAYYYGDNPLDTETGMGPLILGHEFSGEVVQVGLIPARKGLFKPGDRVVVDPLQYCYACEICKKGQFNLCENKNGLGISHNGGFAEYCVSHYTGLHKIPDNVSYVEAAMTEPLADAVYAVQKMSVKLGDFCVVIGPGAIGIMMLQLIKSSGAGTIVLIGTRDYRLEVGKDSGADVIINTAAENSPYYVADLKARIEALTDGKFANAVVTATGSVEAMETALEISGRRSTIVYFGLPSDEAVIRVHPLSALLWDKSILFSWLAPLTWPTALKAIANGLVDVKKLHTHTFKLEDLGQGLADVKSRKGNIMKAIVEP